LDTRDTDTRERRKSFETEADLSSKQYEEIRLIHGVSIAGGILGALALVAAWVAGDRST
jgi:hypothetical protein